MITRLFEPQQTHETNYRRARTGHDAPIGAAGFGCRHPSRVGRDVAATSRNWTAPARPDAHCLRLVRSKNG
jgi:hypothetical protein